MTPTASDAREAREWLDERFGADRATVELWNALAALLARTREGERERCAPMVAHSEAALSRYLHSRKCAEDRCSDCNRLAREEHNAAQSALVAALRAVPEGGGIAAEKRRAR
jgi:hypothetical protein